MPYIQKKQILSCNLYDGLPYTQNRVALPPGILLGGKLQGKAGPLNVGSRCPFALPKQHPIGSVHSDVSAAKLLQLSR